MYVSIIIFNLLYRSQWFRRTCALTCIFYVYVPGVRTRSESISNYRILFLFFLFFTFRLLQHSDIVILNMADTYLSSESVVISVGRSTLHSNKPLVLLLAVTLPTDLNRAVNCRGRKRKLSDESSIRRNYRQIPSEVVRVCVCV